MDRRRAAAGRGPRARPPERRGGSRLLPVEVRNALVNRVRRRLATVEEARRAASAFRAVPLIVEPSADRLEEAFDLALAFEHPIDDCIYLALAVARQLTLVTADRRMFDLAQRRPDRGARDAPGLRRRWRRSSRRSCRSRFLTRVSRGRGTADRRWRGQGPSAPSPVASDGGGSRPQPIVAPLPRC